jgi:GNAT superfamily N-acetyltransferase
MHDINFEFYQSDFESVFNSHEFRALLLNNWIETGLSIAELDPDWTKYKTLEDVGALRIYLAKDKRDDAIVGYCVMILSNHLHYKTTIQALCDMIFIRPTRRGFGKNFIAWIDEKLKTEGVFAVYRHATTKNRFWLMLERMGYKEQETTYVKRL